MKNIAFVFSTTIGNSGGIKIAFEYAKYINETGMAKCDIVYPIIPGNYKLWKFSKLKSIYKFLGTIVFNVFKYNYRKYKELYPSVKIVRVKTLNELSKFKYDTIIATSWESTYYIDKTNSNKKYFVQSYETWDGPTKFVQPTYDNENFQLITITKFLGDILEKAHNRKSILTYNPIYIKNSNYNTIKKYHEIVYGIVYRNIPYKSFNLIIDFLKKHKSYRKKFICVGENVPRKFHQYFSEVIDGSNYENMKKFYNKINTLIVLSNNEGFGLPIIEAMSFGNIIISKETGILYDMGEDKVSYIKIQCNEKFDRSFKGNFENIKLTDLEEIVEYYEKISLKEKEIISFNSIKLVENYFSQLNIEKNIKEFF